MVLGHRDFLQRAPWQILWLVTERGFVGCLDLVRLKPAVEQPLAPPELLVAVSDHRFGNEAWVAGVVPQHVVTPFFVGFRKNGLHERSEERRVGKECRSR